MDQIKKVNKPGQVTYNIKENRTSMHLTAYRKRFLDFNFPEFEF
jgi:hypothetical protein